MFEGIEPEQATNWNKQTLHNCHDTPQFLEQGLVKSAIYSKQAGLSILHSTSKQILVFGFIWNSFCVGIESSFVRWDWSLYSGNVAWNGLDWTQSYKEGKWGWMITDWHLDSEPFTITNRILFWFCNHRLSDKKIAWHSVLSSQCSTKGFIRTNKLPKLPMPSATVTGCDQN